MTADVRVVSLNAWCGAMLEPLAAWLPTVGADVLCVQEVTWTPGHQGWVTYTDADRTSRQRSSLFDDLRQALPEHQAHFYANDTGPVRCEDGVTRTQQFGIATLIAPHLSVVRSATAFVYGAFAAHDVWPAEDRARAAHAVRITVGGARPVTITHFHGVRMGHGKGDSPQRARQAHEVADLTGRVAERDDIVVVAGDMNVLPGSQTLQIFRDRLGLTDLVGRSDTRTSVYPKTVRHADYLLVNDVSAVKGFQVLADPEVSDHRPLLLDVQADRHTA